ncbi:MAG TPA: 5-(carboxyamino)imidazole ribonucleotide synthase [Limnochordales bacterium]
MRNGDPTTAMPAASRPGPGPAVVPPGGTLGILGGGQLGRMTALAARQMGYRVVTLDPAPDAPCAQVADQAVVAALDDVDAARRLAALADVVTYEFENVAAAVAQALEEAATVRPASGVLAAAQDRVREKRTFAALGLPVAAFRPVASRAELEEAAAAVGYPCLLKTATGGYDGKGQYWIRTPADLQPVWSQAAGGTDVPGAAGERVGPAQRFILEARVPFRKELSVIVARNPQGQTAVFPPAENVHRRQILHVSIVPARVPEAVAAAAKQLAVQLAEGLDAVGVLGVELFLDGDDRLYVNEFAPRPHNSGHYTIEACVTSQFQQHVRSVCGLPLGSTALLRPAVMVNLLGQHMAAMRANLGALLAIDGLHLHVYGKREARRDRKMGHVTVLADTLDEALARAQRAWDLVRAPDDPSGLLDPASDSS